MVKVKITDGIEGQRPTPCFWAFHSYLDLGKVILPSNGFCKMEEILISSFFQSDNLAYLTDPTLKYIDFCFQSFLTFWFT